MNDPGQSTTRRPLRIPFWLGGCLIAAIAAFFLWEEHKAHILRVLPWLILLACPIIHFFMHGDHGHNGRQGHDHETAERGDS